MISEEMLKEAAEKSCEHYVEELVEDCDHAAQHEFSPEFEREIQKLRRKADHPVFYRSMQRAASFALAILVTGGAFLTINVEARAAFFGWIKENYGTYFVYQFSGEREMPAAPEQTPKLGWIPDGYTIWKENDTGSRKSVIYANEAGQLLRFNYTYEPSGTAAMVDTSSCTVKQGEVAGHPAELFISSDPEVSSGVAWIDDQEHAFMIFAFLEEGELLSLANSVYETD